MKTIVISLVAVALVGCTPPPYNTIKTGSDRYTLIGPDPHQLQGNAFQTCKKDGYVDYTVVDSGKNRLDIKCENPPQSFFSQASEKAEKAWEYVKQKVDDYRKESTETKEDEANE